jgi:hypothetical protein
MPLSPWRGSDAIGGVCNLMVCPDPKLITEPKTFYIQVKSILLGLKDFCHSRR